MSDPTERPTRERPPSRSEPPSASTPSRRLANVRPATSRCRIVVRRGDEVTEHTDPEELPALLADETARIWVDLVDPTPPETQRVAHLLGLHPLLAEDIAERNHRAKVSVVDDAIHIVVFHLAYAGQVASTEVDLIAKPRVLVTVHDGTCALEALPQLRFGPGPLLAKGIDYLLYAILDGIVDGYFPVIDALADEIDQLQDDVVESASTWSLDRLFVLKRELIDLRRATSPAREILNQLTNRELEFIAPAHVVYFRDVYDHLIRVTDELDNYRELVAGTLEVYLSTVNNNLSTIMKRLTGVTVILAGVGAVAGLFGMSEATLAFSGGEGAGFWIVTVGVIGFAAATAVVLRRIDWI